jgi:hypothetical protein
LQSGFFLKDSLGQFNTKQGRHEMKLTKLRSS